MEKYDRIYTGQTNDINMRLDKHNSGRVRSTNAYIPWRLIHSEEFDIRAEAMAREKELKSHRGRDFIRNEVLSWPSYR
ncbi:MAG: GIY-YIG nuclease family protein [candidate division Zixibacteria bacterium]|nr:GIY-YIG nuclease family protein [candidate division Zixibacteria bacterium]